MFRYGGVLLVPWDVNCGGTSNPCNQVILHKWANVQVGDTIVIFTHPKVPGPISCRLADILPESHCAVHNVTDVQPVKVGSTDALKVTFDRRPDAPPEVTYCASDVDENGKPIFTNGCSAGVGVIARDGQDLGCTQWADACFYRADLGDVDEPFLDAFTIVARHPTGEGEGAVPYLREFSMLNEDDTPICDRVNATRRFHQIWFAHQNPLNCLPPQGCTGDRVDCLACCNVPQNYFHVVGSSRNRTTTDDEPDALMGIADASSDMSLILGDAIERRCTECTDDERRNVYRHVTAHELAHQFRLNKVCRNDGHDDNVAWCQQCAGPQPLEKCMMHVFMVVDEMQDAVNRLDCYNLIGSMAHPTCRGDVGSIRCGEVLRTTADPK